MIEGQCSVFDLGRDYTRDEIHAAVGGSKRACLPTRGGAVVAACLLRSLNSRTPDVVLCGRGARNGPAGALLVAQRTPVPFFTRIAPRRWRHEGWYRVVEALTTGPRYERHVVESGRAPTSVSTVVLLERVGRDGPDAAT